MPRTMNRPVSSPNPPASDATVGTTMSATSGDTRLLMMAARRAASVTRPRAASIGGLLLRAGEFRRHVDFQPEKQERERLAVRVQSEGLIHAAVERPVQHEVHRVHPGQ